MPLLWLSLAYINGVVLGELLGWSARVWFLLGVILVCLYLSRPLIGRLFLHVAGPLGSFIKRHFHKITQALSKEGENQLHNLSGGMMALIMVFLCLGAARYQLAQPDLTSPDFIAAYSDLGEQVVIRGVLTEPPDVRDAYVNLRIRTETIRLQSELHNRAVNGLILVRSSIKGQWHYGDRLVLRGDLERPPENELFSYRNYLARQGVYTYMPDAQVSLLESGQGNALLGAIYVLRERAHDTVKRLWPDPEASLMAGILLGIESGIPEGVQQDFEETGTSHIIAISGFNITILAGLFISIFGRLFGQRRGALVAGLGIGIYTILVGADPAVVRAAIMGGLSLLASQVGRRQDGLNSLGFTAGVMAGFNPNVLWDAGFQLSFAATLGLVLYAEPLTTAFIRLASRFLTPGGAERLAGPAGEFLLFTLAAQVTTLPLMAYHFGRLSLVALVANPIILPAQPPLMVLGGLAVMLGLIYQPLGRLAAPLAWPFVVFTIRAVEFFGSVPGDVLILGRVGLGSVLLYYGILLGWTLERTRLRTIMGKLMAKYGDGKSAGPVASPLIALLGLGIVTMLVWRAALTRPDGLLHLYLLDVSQNSSTGEALFIQTPGGRYLLINGGPSPSRLSEALGRRLPLFHRQLDYLVVAGSRKESLDALPYALERYPPNEVLWVAPSSATNSARYLRQTLDAAQIGVIPAQAGQSLQLGGGANLQVLTTGKRGGLLLLEWQRFRALLPIGINFEDLEALGTGRQIGPVSALMLAEGGYAPINPPDWIENLSPQVLLLSVASGDKDGLPSPETLETVQGYNLLRTDQQGWIHLSTDGEELWVEVERR